MLSGRAVLPFSNRFNPHDGINSMIEMHAIVKGRVQGVGFRATVRAHASALGLTGYVRNLPDGRVELVAQGDQDKLDQLLVQLRQESGAHIENIAANTRLPMRSYDAFSITHDW